MEDFTGGPRQSLPCSAGDTSLIPDSGGPHISWSNYIHVPQLLSPHTATTEAHMLRACALQQKKPLR